MITPELIARINELSRKKRSVGLSDDETQEQQRLRREYLDSIRAQRRGDRKLRPVRIQQGPHTVGKLGLRLSLSRTAKKTQSEKQRDDATHPDRVQPSHRSTTHGEETIEDCSSFLSVLPSPSGS